MERPISSVVSVANAFRILIPKFLRGDLDFFEFGFL